MPHIYRVRDTGIEFVTQTHITLMGMRAVMPVCVEFVTQIYRTLCHASHTCIQFVTHIYRVRDSYNVDGHAQ